MFDLLQKLAVYREKYYNLMTDRYANWDRLNKDMIVLCVALNFLNLFIRSHILALIAALFFFAPVFRVFSKNIDRREDENTKYFQKRKAFMEWLKIMYKRIAEIKTHRYYRCKNCDAYIRVPYKKGSHTIDCPKCGKEFKVKML